MRETRTVRAGGLTGVLIAIVTAATAAMIVRGQTLPVEQSVAARLRSLGQSIIIYSNDNRGFLPPDLDTLARAMPNQPFLQQARSEFVYIPRPATRLSRRYASRPLWRGHSSRNSDRAEARSVGGCGSQLTRAALER